MPYEIFFVLFWVIFLCRLNVSYILTHSAYVTCFQFFLLGGMETALPSQVTVEAFFTPVLPDQHYLTAEVEVNSPAFTKNKIGVWIGQGTAWNGILH